MVGALPDSRTSTEIVAEHLRERFKRGELATFDDYVNPGGRRDRKSTRLNSSHVASSYAVFCLKKKKNLSRFEGSTASLSSKYKSAARRRSIADRSGQRCFALPGWSARFDQLRTLRASGCLQNS